MNCDEFNCIDKHELIANGNYCRYCGQKRNVCSCKKSYKPNTDLFCSHCGSVLPKYEARTRSGKKIITSIRWEFCPTCNPYPSDHPKFKNRARDITNNNKDKLNIISECSCDTTKKVYHHPDYNFPLSVMKLCTRCHWDEHIRINREKKQQLTTI